MWQRKQTIFLAVAVILTVICLCTQIGSYNAAGLDVSRVYKLRVTDPLGHGRFDVWPLFAVLLPTAALGTYTIFIFKNRKIQALFCALNVLLIVGWYICFFVVAQTVDNKSWGTVDFRPAWPAVLPAIALIFYLMARHAILADEKLVRSMDRIR